MPTQLRKIYERESKFEVGLEISVDVLQVPDAVQFFVGAKGQVQILNSFIPTYYEVLTSWKEQFDFNNILNLLSSIIEGEAIIN